MSHGTATDLLARTEPLASGAARTEAGPAELYRLTVEQYHAMRDTGILADEAPIELLEGLLVCHMVRRPPHDTALGLLQDALGCDLPAGCILRIQSALSLSDGEPESDLVVARGTRRDFSERHPTADDCVLVVEIAEASLALDLGVKLRSYARSGIAEYWVVNLVQMQLDVFTRPTGAVAKPRYRSHKTYFPDDFVTWRIPGRAPCSIPINELLP